MTSTRPDSRSSGSRCSEAQNVSEMFRVLDPGDVCRLLLGLETAGKRDVERLPVGIDRQRNPRTLRRLGRDHVHVGGLTGSILSTARRNTTSAMPIPVALPSVSSVRSRMMMRWMRGLNRALPSGAQPDDVAVDHVRVGAIAGDVLADAVDDQDVDPLAGQASHPLAGDLEQFLLPLPDCGPRALPRPRARCAVAVLDHGDPERDIDLAERELGDGGDQMVELIDALGMEEFGALLFAKPDGDHLHQA